MTDAAAAQSAPRGGVALGWLRVYRDLLGNRPLVRLLLGEFVSGIGDWLYIVAIFVVIYSESGSAALVGAFGAIRLLPYVVLSVPAGIIADRVDRRIVLLVSDLYRGALMVVMAKRAIAARHEWRATHPNTGDQLDPRSPSITPSPAASLSPPS